MSHLSRDLFARDTLRNIRIIQPDAAALKRLALMLAYPKY